jgi:6-phosphogluconolactonase
MRTQRTSIGTLEIVHDAEAVAAAAAMAISAAARAAPRVGLFLAGGSTARRAYEVVATTASAADFATAHVWLVDDRPVALDHPESNAGMVLGLWQALGLARDGAPVARFHAMTAPAGTAAQLAELERDLRALGGAAPQPDLAVLGVGGDGHVGGLLPGDPGLAAGGLYTSVKDGYRLTMTRGLLAASRRLMFLVSGAAKADLLVRLLAEPRGFPAGMIAVDALAAGGEVTWLLDAEAAARL